PALSSVAGKGAESLSDRRGRHLLARFRIAESDRGHEGRTDGRTVDPAHQKTNTPSTREARNRIPPPPPPFSILSRSDSMNLNRRDRCERYRSRSRSYGRSSFAAPDGGWRLSETVRPSSRAGSCDGQRIGAKSTYSPRSRSVASRLPHSQALAGPHS